MDDTLADPLAGRLLDRRYAVTARIAHGGMATVYRAMDTRLDREVALKVMHAELVRDEDFVRRFIGEAKSVARLSHQNVVAVFDQGADGPFVYLAMEYVPGRTLKETLRDAGRFAPGAALQIMTGVLDGLAAAHLSGIAHRDVKPENVLVTADGRLKVADFGLARAYAAAGHTRTGLLIGTVGYVPPEQVLGGSTGPRSDVYSAGVMLFELLTGQLPYRGDTPLAVAYQHVNSEVPAPSTLVPDIPAAVDQLVLAATSRDPARRPADAGEFARAVRLLGGYGGAGSPPVSRGGSGGIVPPEEQSVMGMGVQGLAEAPWLDLDTPAATNGWWARSGTLPVPDKPAPEKKGPRHAAGGNGTEPGGSATGQVDMAQFATGPVTGARGGDGGSHTLIVSREDGGRYRGGGEPFLQRWLFSPRVLVIALIAALGIGLGLGGWWMTSGRYGTVPQLKGDTVALATTVLTADGFKVKQGTPVHSNQVPKGDVVATSPAGRVAKGSVISLLVSAGPFTSVVPRVAGEQLNAAEAALRSAHLTTYGTQQVAANVAAGTVIGTKPPAGTTWPQTQSVTIEVSAGPPVPSFFGQNVEVAQQWADQHGVRLQQVPDPNSQQPSGIVTGQEPAAGSIFQPGQTVTVNVSSGPAIVPVPNPIGLTAEQASQTLQAAGFKVQVNNYGPLDKVFDYSPVTPAPRGSTIILDVGF
jgi:serine/threonine-protein kinase